MSDTCGKDGTREESASSKKTGAEYQARQEKQADKTIERCVRGEVTENQARADLAKQFVSDPKGFLKAIEKLEKELNSGRVAREVSVRMGKGERTLIVRFDDGREDYYSINYNGEIWHAVGGSGEGILYDSTLRDTESHKGFERFSALAGSERDNYVNHTTQYYPDGYRVSWDNPGQRNLHWTNMKVDWKDPDRHTPPDDAHRENDPRK